MADYGRGAKAGAIAGVVTGIIEAIGTIALFSFTANDIKTALQGTTLPAGITIDQAVTAAMYLAAAVTFIASIIVGLILGVIFAAVANKYMTSKSFEMRGLVFGIILWIIGILGNINNSYGSTYIAASIVIG